MAVDAKVDILSVIFPTKIYLMLMEKLHPNWPPGLLQEAVRGLSTAEKQVALSQAQAVAHPANEIVHALEAK